MSSNQEEGVNNRINWYNTYQEPKENFLKNY